MRYVVSARAVSCFATVCCAVLVAGCAAPEPAERAASGQPSVTATATSTASLTATATSTATRVDGPVIEVRIAKGRVTPPPGRVEVARGDRVVFTVTSDVVDEVHLHGYDIDSELRPGGTTTVEVTADMPGLFEVETHDSGTQLFQLLVR